MNWKNLFYQPVKIKTHNKNVLVVGCPHVGHDPNWAIPIWKTRGYASAEAFTEGFIKNWNSKANESTVGFLLGDICFNDPKGDRFKDLFNRLVFKEAYVMAGNHYSGFRQVFEECEENVYQIGEKRLIFTPNYLEAWINGQAVVMSHYPILSWNGQAKGSYHLFSHVHGQLERSVIGKMYKESGARALEVSVEAYHLPLTFAEVRSILDARTPVSFDHHDSNTNNPF